MAVLLGERMPLEPWQGPVVGGGTLATGSRQE